MKVEGIGDLAIFPCRLDKKPLVKAWPTAAKPIEPPDHWPLVGVPTGRLFSVLDIDIVGLPWFDAQCLPLTRTHQTKSGGLHLLFKHVDGLRNSAARIADGVDVRAEGGFVIFWPREGLPVCSAPLAEWPGELGKFGSKFRSAISPETPGSRGQEGRGLKECRVSVTPGSREGRYARKALSNAFDKLANDWPKDQGRAKRGGRSDLLNKLAFKMGGLVANGWLDATVVVRVLMLAARECKLVADYSAQDCHATILSGLRAGIQFPYPELGPYNGPALPPSCPADPGVSLEIAK
jgi:hypothetical protein